MPGLDAIRKLSLNILIHHFRVQIFSMLPMDGFQWGLVVLFAVAVFVIMEAEKSLRNYLTFLKYDTEDKEYDGIFDDHPEPPHPQQLPSEVDRFGKDTSAR